MKEKLKKAIIILCTISLILLVILILIKQNNKDNEINNNDSIRIQGEKEKYEYKYVDNKNSYYTVKRICTNFLNEAIEGNYEQLILKFNSNYLQENNITQQSISEIVAIPKIADVSSYYTFNVEEMYYLDQEGYTAYFVYGHYEDTEEKDLNLLVVLDTINMIYDIYPYDYIIKNNYDNLNLGDEVFLNIDSVEDRDTNSFIYTTVTEEEMANNYLEEYKELLLEDKDKAYDLLDSNYANAKFGTKENFYSFVDNKKVKFFVANVKYYSSRINENGKLTYICIDQNQNYYYFIETYGVMEYKVMLDNYIISSEEFIETYNSTTKQGKVALNIDKFFKAINDKSYYYAYNCLSDGFKNNYFKSVEDFEKYINENLYSNNEIQYVEFKEESGLYTYTIKIVNADNKNESIEKSIIMQLNDGTDFEMSFNI